MVRRRRMVRTYTDQPVDPASVDRMLEHATRSPSAGFSQGWAFLLLDKPGDVAGFWECTSPPETPAGTHPTAWLEGMTRAPVVIVPMSCKEAYLHRYAEPDKPWQDRDESHWPVPFWYIDTGFAALLVLLTAVDTGLGALFFGIADPTAFRTAYDIPPTYDPIGAIVIGYPAPARPSASLKRGHRPPTQIIHRGTW